jgi:hypothetical protein
MTRAILGAILFGLVFGALLGAVGALLALVVLTLMSLPHMQSVWRSDLPLLLLIGAGYGLFPGALIGVIVGAVRASRKHS